jgi:hypothetical protein
MSKLSEQPVPNPVDWPYNMFVPNNESMPCPWCGTAMPGGQIALHMRSGQCAAATPERIEAAKAAHAKVFGAFKLLADHDGRKRETKEEYEARRTLFPDSLKDRLPHPLHYDYKARANVVRMVKLITGDYPMSLRAFAYQSAKRRWPGVVDRIADSVKQPIEGYLVSAECVDLRAKSAE